MKTKVIEDKEKAKKEVQKKLKEFGIDQDEALDIVKDFFKDEDSEPNK
jgi:DNA-binding transcriptional regulator YhcF (GntR family)